MNGLKRLSAMILAVAVAFQLLAPHVFAVTVSWSDYSTSRRTVLINIATDSNDTSDFVRTFPKNLAFSEVFVQYDPLEPVLGQTLEQTGNSSYQEDGVVPAYLQSDYPEALYGEGTVATDGSSITALAMMATYLTGYEYLPDEMARWFAGKADDDASRLVYASEALGLSFAASQNLETAYEQLQAGKYCIIQLDHTSIFADSQSAELQDSDFRHFVVLCGITEDGKILVNDPMAGEYLSEELKECLVSGFTESDISIGFQYALIYDKDEVPADLAQYTEIPADSGESRYASLGLTVSEKQLLARVVCLNAGRECEEGQQAIIEVLLNRMLSDDFPDELKKIVYGENALCEISLLNEAEPERIHYLAVERAMYGPYILTEDVTEFAYVCHR